MKRKYLILNLLFLVSTPAVWSQNKSQAFLTYIDKYAELAVIQQHEFGIPASIKLAQGLLESGAGQSDFVRRSNNHFGIKCHNEWKGERIYHDDDAIGECFRKYESVLESYTDHSLFLKRPRYAFLFNYSKTDYKSWAHGLKQAGYATDPTYAYKLISLIENYDLQRFDKIKHYNPNTHKKQKFAENKLLIPGNIQILNPHKVYKINRVKFIVSQKGDTFESIADGLNIEVSQLYEFNDLSAHTVLEPGTQLFIQRKKARAAKGFDVHVIKKGESMYTISQTYAIRLQKLYDMNQMSYDQFAQIGKVLILR